MKKSRIAPADGRCFSQKSQLLAAVIKFVAGDDIRHSVEDAMPVAVALEGSPKGACLGAGTAVLIAECSKILIFDARKMLIQFFIEIQGLPVT